MREITTHPDPVLRQKCRALTDEEIKNGIFDGISIRDLVEEMTALMRDKRHPGVGLAAPQVGVPIRLFIAALPGSENATLVCINPELSDPRGKTEESEGCLSLPSVKVKVKRAQMVKLKAKNINGVEFGIDANGLLARVFQHESDHLDGITILQRGPCNSKANREALDHMERVYKTWTERQQKKAAASSSEKMDENNGKTDN